MITIELSLEDAEYVKCLLQSQIEKLSIVTDKNYPRRYQDIQLKTKLETAISDHIWYKGGN